MNQEILINQLDFWLADRDSRNVKGRSSILTWVWSKVIPFNQITGFLNQLYLMKKVFMEMKSRNHCICLHDDLLLINAECGSQAS